MKRPYLSLLVVICCLVLSVAIVAQDPALCVWNYESFNSKCDAKQSIDCPAICWPQKCADYPPKKKYDDSAVYKISYAGPGNLEATSYTLVACYNEYLCEEYEVPHAVCQYGGGYWMCLANPLSSCFPCRATTNITVGEEVEVDLNSCSS